MVVNYLRAPEHAEQVVKGIWAAGGEAMAIGADVSREEQVKGMFEQMLEAYGSIDILVNNAAVDAGSELTDMSLDEWDRVLRVNLTS